MAGHSKWKNIQHRKGKQDAIRGKLFTKLGREIIMAAKSGGDPMLNAKLRVILEKARLAGLPQENIKRAIQRGTGEIEGADYEEITYEGTGPGGSAVIIECYSENRNRTVADLRHAFVKNGGNLGENGSVAWQFKFVGEIIVPVGKHDEDEITMAALEAGAQDVSSDEENFIIETKVEDLHACTVGLAAAGYTAADSYLTYVATNMATPSDDDMLKLAKLLDVLDELDDVKETYSNVDIPEEIYEKL